MTITKKSICILAAAIIIAVDLFCCPATQAGGWEMYAAGDQANRQGKYEDAVVLLTDAVESEHLMGTELASAYFSRGFAFRSLDRFQEALDDYNLALEAQPSLAEDEFFYSARSLALLGLERYDEAMADADRALDLAPDSAFMISTRGMIRQKNGQYEAAIKDQRRALEISPGLWKAKASLAWVLATCPDEKLRDGTQAVELAERAAKVKPEPYTLDALGAAYAEAGRFDEAVRILELAIGMLEQQGRTGQTEPLKPHLTAYKNRTPWRD